MKKRILITGLSGLLGNNLAYCLKDSYDILGVYHNHRIVMDGIKTVSADLTSGIWIDKTALRKAWSFSPSPAFNNASSVIGSP